MLAGSERNVLQRELRRTLPCMDEIQTSGLPANAQARDSEIAEMLRKEERPARSEQPGNKAVDSHRRQRRIKLPPAPAQVFGVRAAPSVTSTIRSWCPRSLSRPQ